MTCPKCEEGTLNKILFKKSQQAGLLCELCGAVWFEHENVKATTGHYIRSLTINGDMDYTFVDTERDENKPVRYEKYK